MLDWPVKQPVSSGRRRGRHPRGWGPGARDREGLTCTVSSASTTTSSSPRTSGPAGCRRSTGRSPPTWWRRTAGSTGSSRTSASRTMGTNAVVGKPREEWNVEPISFEDMTPGLLRPGAAGGRHAVTGDLRQRQLPDPAAIRRGPVRQLQGQRAGPRLRAGMERLRARRVVRRRSGHVRADGDLPALGPEARRRGDPPLRRQGRQGVVLRREPTPLGLPSFHHPATGTRCSDCARRPTSRCACTSGAARARRARFPTRRRP